ncbi:type III-B CRISPR module-associated Cmr3 family protein [Actinopolyspora sp. H202]|uniref:type III-B CRISPR module-associated Cmr3 family protein n=1 Tax=Actinopolyspora sp. H202 TaxID=1500456 RepID=UPI003EE5F334
MSEHARVTVLLDETVATGKNAQSDHRQDTHEHIPGSVLRGAIAADWIRRSGQSVTTTPEFTSIFEGRGSFGPLHTPASLPIPLSVRVHKYEPTRKCHQLWWDEAFDDDAERCPHCEGPLERSKGQARGGIPTTTRTTAALTADGEAEDSALFSQRALSQGLRLHGWLHGEAVRALNPDGTPITSLLLGSRRSVRGKASVEVDHAVSPGPVETTGNDVVLRLAAPAVFVDDFGLPSTTPDLSELSEALGVEASEVRGSWTRWDETGGWHAASGLPKPTERCVAAGSTYRVRCAEPPAEEALRTLMARGVGLRRREGFGALFRTEPPLGFAAWTSVAASLRQLPGLIPKLRERLDPLRRGTVDDESYYRASHKMPPDVGEALRTILGITDADFYEQLLDYMEHG